jgi:hypothetical protein
MFINLWHGNWYRFVQYGWYGWVVLLRQAGVQFVGAGFQEKVLDRHKLLLQWAVCVGKIKKLI